MIQRILLLAFSSVWLLPVQAETDAPVYRVEMIVFERSETANRNDLEQWSKTLELTYPSDWIRLVSPEQAEEIKIRQREEQEQFRLSDGFFRSIGEQASASPADSETRSESHPSSQSEPYFRFLSDEHKTLKESAGALNRAGYLRTLLHETWLQPMRPENQAPALVIRGGNQYGNHTELEGYIHIFLSRYLHLQTNLWFTEFVPNYGQISEHWPDLPEFPKNYLTSEELPVPQDDAPLAETMPRSHLTSSTDTYFDLTGKDIDSPQTSGADEDPTDQPYLIQQTITLQQNRRMRSEQLHYIDHPRLGILIKIYPHSVPKQNQESE